MDQTTERILTDGSTLAECIQQDLFERRTIMYKSSKIQDDWLKGCKRLHILGAPADAGAKRAEGVAPGYYYDFRESSLYIIGAQEDKVQFALSHCDDDLEEVDIWFTELEKVDVAGLKQLRCLKLRHNHGLKQIEGLEQLEQLEELELCASSFERTLDVKRLKNLRTLHMNGEHAPGCICGISQLEQLQCLRLESVSIPEVLDLDRLPGLEEFRAFDVQLTGIRLTGELSTLRVLETDRLCLKDYSFLTHLTGLEKLSVLREQIVSLPDLEQCTRLREIVAAGSAVRRLGSLPAGLERLDLSGTGVRQIPESIRQLKQLKWLKLDRTKLTELPVWLADLELPVYVDETDREKGVFFHLTQVEGVDMFAMPKQRSWLREWLEMQQPGTQKPPNEIKVVLLGDGEAGKSLLVSRLMADGKKNDDFDGNSTPGIAIYNRTMQLSENRTVMVHYWDYGGQEILYTMHRVFMTARTLYVVVLNARNDTQDDRARHWLQFISSVVPNPRVLLVLNKIDQNPRASLNETELKMKFPGLCGVVRMSAREDSQEDFNQKLTKMIREQISEFDSIQNPVPAVWHRVKQEMQNIGEKYIRGDRFEEICDKLQIPDDEEKRKDLLALLSDMGVIFHCDAEERIDDYVLLQPEWVTNAIYAILFNKHDDIKNGIISNKKIRDFLKCHAAGSEKDGGGAKTMDYSVDEVDYILNVMRVNALSYPLKNKKEFIPMLCDRNAPPLVREYMEDPLSTEIWWKFEFLPESLLFRLMVNWHHMLDRDHVWLTGARFVDDQSGDSAVVRREGNILKIHARSGGGRSPLGDFCRSIEGEIRKVIKVHFQGMCRNAQGRSRDRTGYEFEGVERLLVHKVGREREVFDCLQLEAAHNGTKVYSRCLEEHVPAEDIYRCAYDGRDSVRGKLVRDVLEACTDIQEMPMYWDTKDGSRENSRNSEIRNILRAKGYHIQDQTLCGKARGRNQEGELDLEIRQDINQPWTILEALNLSTTNLAYWNEHLNRLLDNYNPCGLKILLLVSYVTCSEQKFSRIWTEYQKHIPAYHAGIYRCIPSSYMPLPTRYLEDRNFIKGAQCTYDCGDSRTTVYHIFVRLGEGFPGKAAE